MNSWYFLRNISLPCYINIWTGLSPSFYKSNSYRSRIVREPRKVLTEFGTYISSDRRIVVSDSTADCRYLVMPMRPQGSEGWSEEQLKGIVTRDSMIGVCEINLWTIYLTEGLFYENYSARTPREQLILSSFWSKSQSFWRK